MSMKTYKLGFIGAGNMAEAIFSGIISKNFTVPENIYAYDINSRKLIQHQMTYNINTCESEQDVVDSADIIWLAVKPNVAPGVLKKIDITGKSLVSIVAGLSYEEIRKNLPTKNPALLRTMPNTPFMAGEGAIAFAKPYTVSEETVSFVEKAFSSIGIVEYVEEKLINAVTGVSGSGPAYVYIFIDALADAGVKHGLPRKIALELAAQTVLGSAKMVLKTNKHPDQLKDDVCSPGGTTIEAVAKLEEYGMRNAIIQAVDACVAKAYQL